MSSVLMRCEEMAWRMNTAGRCHPADSREAARPFNPPDLYVRLARRRGKVAKRLPRAGFCPSRWRNRSAVL